MTLILHIGYPKTSTTYLQNFYFNKLNLKFLGKELYSESWLNSKERLKYNQYIKKLTSDPINNKFNMPKKNTLISSESLIGNIWRDDFYKFSTLDKLLKYKKIKFIITIRRQSEIFYSLYKQYLWEGGKKEFNKFYQDSFSMKNKEFDVNCLNYNKLYSKLSKKLNKNKFIIIPSEMICEKHFNHFNKIISNFLNLKIKKIKYRNTLIRTGYSTNEQFYIRICNILVNYNLNNHKTSMIGETTFLGKITSLRSYFLKLAKVESFFLKREVENLNKIKKEIDKYFLKSNKNLSKKLYIDLKKFNYY